MLKKLFLSGKCLALATILLFFISCQERYKRLDGYELPDLDNKLVIEGELSSNLPINEVTVKHTIPPLSTEPEYVNNAIVEIWTPNQGFYERLSLDGNGLYKTAGSKIYYPDSIYYLKAAAPGYPPIESKYDTMPRLGDKTSEQFDYDLSANLYRYQLALKKPSNSMLVENVNVAGFFSGKTLGGQNYPSTDFKTNDYNIFHESGITIDDRYYNNGGQRIRYDKVRVTRQVRSLSSVLAKSWSSTNFYGDPRKKFSNIKNGFGFFGCTNIEIKEFIIP